MNSTLRHRDKTWPRRNGPLIFLTLVFWWLSGAVVPARAKEPELERRLHERYVSEAKVQYLAKEYARAIELLEKAFILYPDPLIHKNLGAAYKAIGDTKKALHHYRIWLRLIPTLSDRTGKWRRSARTDAEEQVRQLEAERTAAAGTEEGSDPDPKTAEASDKRASSSEPAPSPPCCRPPEKVGLWSGPFADHLGDTSRKWWFWAGVGTTLLLSGITVYSGLMALYYQGQAKDEADGDRYLYDRHIARMKEYQRNADWALFSSILAAGALTYGIWSQRPSVDGRGPSPVQGWKFLPGGGPTPLSLGVRFDF